MRFAMFIVPICVALAIRHEVACAQAVDTLDLSEAHDLGTLRLARTDCPCCGNLMEASREAWEQQVTASPHSSDSRPALRRTYG